MIRYILYKFEFAKMLCFTFF